MKIMKQTKYDKERTCLSPTDRYFQKIIILLKQCCNTAQVKTICAMDSFKWIIFCRCELINTFLQAI